MMIIAHLVTPATLGSTQTYTEVAPTSLFNFSDMQLEASLLSRLSDPDVDGCHVLPPCILSLQVAMVYHYLDTLVFY